MFEDFFDLEQEVSRQATTKGKGDLFEEFAKFYFQYFATKYQIQDVFLGKEIPSHLRTRLELESSDYGVDGIATRIDGKILAFQVKFRSDRQAPTSRELSMFWSESENADSRLVFTNANKVPQVADKHSLAILGTDLEKLDKEFFSAFSNYLLDATLMKPQIKIPLDYQRKMIDVTSSGLKTHGKGRLVAACGTGKTLVSLWIAEDLKAKSVIFFAPSIALIKQTIDSWSSNSKTGFRYLAVCSDETVTSEIERLADYSVHELDFTATTSPSEIIEFLTSSRSDDRPTYIFSTYQSSEALLAAVNSVETFDLDLLIFDEAHKTAGSNNDPSLTSILKEEHLKSKYRLFMTATEKLVAPWIVSKAEESQRVLFSMDNESVYGPNLHTYNFGQAISEGVIAGYQVVAVDLPEDEITDLIRSRGLVEDGDNQDLGMVETEFLYKQAVLGKAIRSKGLRKVLTFHSNINRARTFVHGSKNHALPIDTFFGDLGVGEISHIDHVDGTMSAQTRKEILSEFANSDFGLVSNARCLTEGVDVPVIDAVYFADPKSSMVDIVQAVGRALRKPYGVDQKTAYLIIPAMYSESGDLLDESFATLIKVLQAIASQDERLAQTIERLNLEKAKGGHGGNGKSELGNFIEWPARIDFAKFGEQIETKIITSLVGPASPEMKARLSVRRSRTQKILKPIADYAPETVFEKLVDSTLESFTLEWEPPKKGLPNNAISHTLRLGLIEKNKYNQVRISALGQSYMLNEISRDEIFRQACLNYSVPKSDPELRPYAALIKVLSNLGEMNLPQFIFGVYTIRNGSDEEIERVIDASRKVQEMYPHLGKISPTNREIALSDLNLALGTDYEVSEVWGSTTVKNRFGYFKSHLSLFEDIIGTPTSLRWMSD